MTNLPTQPSFTEELKDQVCAILQRGSDRQTAANLLGLSLADLRQQLRADPTFRRQVRQAEAACEFRHMEHLQKAAGDEKNWRVSVWWLERRAPERFARRDPGVVTARQLEAFVDVLATAIAEDVHDRGDRRRLLRTMKRMAASFAGIVDGPTRDIAPIEPLHDAADLNDVEVDG